MMYRDFIPEISARQDKSQNFQEISGGRSDILQRDVKEPKETVPDVIKRWLRETGLTAAEVHENAKKRGLKVSAGYIDDLKNGRTDNPSSRLMKAVCAGFGKPEIELVSVAMEWDLTDASYSTGLLREIDEKYRRLPPAKQKEKRVLLEMVNRELER